jgi:Uma2 family endonuclease
MALSDRPTTSSTLPDDTGPSRWVGARMTLEEFLALPEEKPYLEYDHGVVTQKMAPFADHSSIQIEFGQALNLTARPGRLGRVFTEMRFVTPDWAPVPDISYYRQERIHPRSRDAFGDFNLPPDLAIEIVSPSQSLGEQMRKCLRYAGLAIPVSLVVDPADRSVYAVRPGQPTQVLRGDDRIDLDDVLPSFSLTVNQLFAASAPDETPDLADNGEENEATTP